MFVVHYQMNKRFLIFVVLGVLIRRQSANSESHVVQHDAQTNRILQLFLLTVGKDQTLLELCKHGWIMQREAIAKACFLLHLLN